MPRESRKAGGVSTRHSLQEIATEIVGDLIGASWTSVRGVRGPIYSYSEFERAMLSADFYTTQVTIRIKFHSLVCKGIFVPLSNREYGRVLVDAARWNAEYYRASITDPDEIQTNKQTNKNKNNTPAAEGAE